MIYTLKNNNITVEIDSKGAEVKSVIRNGIEYMWCGDPIYWGRTSPVLFPFVGSVRNGKYKVDGKEYAMGQHGFARDMEFDFVAESNTSVKFSLCSNPETLEKYPFEFLLIITYTIKENNFTVSWHVDNTNDLDMCFSIGAHPAFKCPINGGNQTDYKLKFNTNKDIEYYLLDKGILDKSEKYVLPLHDGYADIKQGMFDRDALIVEEKQASEVSLCYPDGSAYVTVKTDAPLFGLWSPAGKNAPFICIEPWYGRCDATDFDGDLSEREYSNTISAGGKFDAEYSIDFI